MPHQQSTTYSLPLVQHVGFYGDEDKKDVKTYGSVSTKSKPKKRGLALFTRGEKQLRHCHDLWLELVFLAHLAWISIVVQMHRALAFRWVGGMYV